MKSKYFVIALIVVLFVVLGGSAAFGQGNPGIAGGGTVIAVEGVTTVGEGTTGAGGGTAIAAVGVTTAGKGTAIAVEGVNTAGEGTTGAGEGTATAEEGVNTAGGSMTGDGEDIADEGERSTGAGEDMTAAGAGQEPGISGEELNEGTITEYEVYINQRKLSNKGIFSGNIVMLPLEEFFESLGLEVRIYEDSISITSYNIYIYIKKDCRIVFLNAVPYAMNAPVASFDGLYYFPADLAVNVLNMSVSADDISREITFNGKIEPGLESNLDSLFPASPVFCTIKKGYGLYNNIAGGLTGFCSEDIRAEILMDSGLLWYKVKTVEGQVSWVKRDALIIDTDYQLLTDVPSRDELEIYTVLKGFKSDTGFFVWADISRQLVYVFSQNGKSWSLDRIMQCSTGKNESPTTRGMYMVSDRGEWFYTEAFESGGKYWVRFNGAYLFHSIAMDRYQNIKDDTLGDRATAGCIRLSLEDSKWFYENIPSGTGVYVN